MVAYTPQGSGRSLPAGAPATIERVAPRSGSKLAGAERQLYEEWERALRQPQGRLLIVLHLSRLLAPRAHHVRVARVLLGDTAQRYGGQIFTMSNNDLVLLCCEAAAEEASAPYTPERLPHTLGRLFEADVPQAARLTSLWSLQAQPDCLARYMSGRASDGVALPVGSVIARSQPVSLAGLEEIVARAPMEGLLVQQTGLSLSPDRHLSLAATLAPVFQQISLDLDKLNVGALVAEALSDPFLKCHFGETLDARLLDLLRADLAAQGRQLRSIALQHLPLLIELGLRAIVSPGFAMVSRLAEAAGLRLWVAVSLLQAGAELDLFEHARGVLRMTGARLVLNRLDGVASRMVRPAFLKADIVVLNWSPGLRAALAGQGGLAKRFDADTRFVLAGVDSEHALAWGQSAGFHFFQGLFLDQIQAATRMQRCHSASACTVRQCWTRAASLAMPGRAGCANPALLAAGIAASE